MLFVVLEKVASMDHADVEVQPVRPGVQPVPKKKPAVAVLLVASLLPTVLVVVSRVLAVRNVVRLVGFLYVRI